MLNRLSLGLLVALVATGCSKSGGQKAADEATKKANQVVAEAKDTVNNAEKAVQQQAKTVQGVNPFFTEYDTPFGIPPYSKIKEKHYIPAFEKGMADNLAEIEAIVNNPEAPNFKNTIEAYDRSGELLSKVSSVFFAMSSAHTNDELQKISQEISPKLTLHSDSISFNKGFYERVKSVYEQKDTFNLTTEQARLLDEVYKGFVQSGATLNDEQKAKISKINEEMSGLTLTYGQNILKETNGFELVLDKKEDLAGLPESVIAAASQAAQDKGYKGKWLFTPHRTSLYPFLTYSTRRDLREKLYKSYIMRGDNNNEFDNKKIASRIAKLRAEKAKILGYKTHAHYALESKMSKTPEAVYKLLDQLWPAALKRAKQEEAAMQAMAKSEGKAIKIEGWDWWYYAEKIRQSRYALDDAELRPYFSFDNALNGIFTVSGKLFGITFTELKGMPTFHEDVRYFEVKEKDGTHLGIFTVDPYVRASKNGGAWAGALRGPVVIDGKRRAPIVANTLNFPAPVGDKPSLLSFENVTTLFHEFGHALHALLSMANYHGLAGMSTSSDHAEFPAQIMERWAAEPSVLKMYAKHYQTGKVIPDELIEKMSNASKFNSGFATTEYLAASLLDMNWHTITADEAEKDTNKFEAEYLNKIGLIPAITARYRSTYFSHIFTGEWYSAGYYSYIWSEVLDRDAFELFKEKGLFNQELAASLRKNVYAAGNTDDLMKLYINFRGAEPSVEPLIKGRGLDGK
jgi:peptidyl-dipeptidase Dcp